MPNLRAGTMARADPVDFEFERDEDEVTISARSGAMNFVLVMSHEEATVFAAIASRVIYKSTETTRSRFQLKKAILEVSHEGSPTVLRR